MDSLLHHVRTRAKNYLLRRPGANRRTSLWKTSIGCLGVFYAATSYLFEQSHMILAVFFLGLMLVTEGLADLVYAETGSGKRYAALLRTVTLMCSVVFVALVIVEILFRFVLS